MDPPRFHARVASDHLIPLDNSQFGKGKNLIMRQGLQELLSYLSKKYEVIVFSDDDTMVMISATHDAQIVFFFSKSINTSSILFSSEAVLFCSCVVAQLVTCTAVQWHSCSVSQRSSCTQLVSWSDNSIKLNFAWEIFSWKFSRCSLKWAGGCPGLLPLIQTVFLFVCWLRKHQQNKRSISLNHYSLTEKIGNSWFKIFVRN